MKKLITFISCLFLLNSTFAQLRYLKPIFSEVKVTENVVYGENSTTLFLQQTGHVEKISLLVDVYEPVGDTELERPLILVFHDGGFLPALFNGRVGGHKKDSSVVEICKQFAQRGYVAAACSYRKGWNPAAATQPARMQGLIQAIYRGIQDGRTAVRFFKKTHSGINTFGIDPDKIAVLGLGDAGGYIATGMASLTEYQKLLGTTHGAGKFLIDSDNDGIGDLPAIIPTYHGDIEGKNMAIVPTSDFGIPAGDTSNFSNHPDYSSDFNVAINIGGAIGDISWIDGQGAPIISVHGVDDMFVPYGDATIPLNPFSDFTLRVQGSKEIGKRQEIIGTNDVFKGYKEWDLQYIKAKNNSIEAGHQYFEGLFPWIRPENSFGVNEGIVLNWWNPTDTVPFPEYPNFQTPYAGLALDSIQLPWDTASTFHRQGLFLNEGMSAEKAKSNLDTVLQYVLPRTCLALKLNCNVGAAENLSSVVNLKIAPNPSSDFVMVETEDYPFRAIKIFDLQGRLVRNYSGLKTTTFKIEKGDLKSGIHLLSVQFKEGKATQKLIFK